MHTCTRAHQIEPPKGNTSSSKYLKVAAIVKHSFDYDLEGNHGPVARTAFNAVVSEDDQVNYFWPPFEAVLTRANASGLMCSYNAVNGIPSCLNSEVYVLQPALSLLHFLHPKPHRRYAYPCSFWFRTDN